MSARGYQTLAIREKKALALKRQPTQLRRCLGCDWWMRSTGPDHRVCNRCKGEYTPRGSGFGTRVGKGPRDGAGA